MLFSPIILVLLSASFETYLKHSEIGLTLLKKFSIASIKRDEETLNNREPNTVKQYFVC